MTSVRVRHFDGVAVFGAFRQLLLACCEDYYGTRGKSSKGQKGVLRGAIDGIHPDNWTRCKQEGALSCVDGSDITALYVYVAAM